MEKIFSSINEFSTQTKKDWIRKFENEYNIQLIINYLTQYILRKRLVKKPHFTKTKNGTSA